MTEKTEQEAKIEFLAAVGANSIQRLDALVRDVDQTQVKRTMVLQAVNENGDNGFHIWARNPDGDERVASFLFRHRVLIDHENNKGLLPIQVAEDHGNIRAVDLLRNMGADKNKLGQTDSRLRDVEGAADPDGGFTGGPKTPEEASGRAFLAAASAGHTSSILAVVRGALNEQFNKKARDKGTYPVMTQIANTVDKDGNNGLHLWARSSKGAKTEILDVLAVMLRYGTELNRPNSLQQTPLRVAVESNNVFAVKKLLEIGAREKDYNGLMTLATEKGFKDIQGVLSQGMVEAVKTAKAPAAP